MNTTEIVVCTLGTRGDILPFLALCRPFLANGFRVSFLTNKNWADLVQSTGAEFIEIAEADPPQTGRNDQKFFLERILPTFGRSFEIIEQISSRSKQCAIIYRYNMAGAESAAEKLRLPNVKIALQPSAIFSAERPPWPLTGLAEGLLGPLVRRVLVPSLRTAAELFGGHRREVNKFRQSIGLAKIPLCKTGSGEDLFFVLCPEWFAMAQHDWPSTCRVAGFPFFDTTFEDKQLDDFIERHGAPLVFTPGTGVSEPQEFFSVANEICRLTNLPGIFLSPVAKLPWRCPANIVLRDYVELGSLLPRSRLLVHHGGIGSTAQAIRAGIPQLIIPDRFDQPDNGVRVAMLGLGGAVFSKRVSPDAVASLITEMLNDPVTRSQLKRAAQLVEQEDPAEFVYSEVAGLLQRAC